MGGFGLGFGFGFGFGFGSLYQDCGFSTFKCYSVFKQGLVDHSVFVLISARQVLGLIYTQDGIYLGLVLIKNSPHMAFFDTVNTIKSTLFGTILVLL